MAIRLKFTLRYILIGLLGLFLFAVSYLFFVYNLFPYRSLETYIVQYLERASGADITVGSGKIKFPLILEWNKILISRDEQQLLVDNLVLDLEPIALVSGYGDLQFTLSGLGGEGFGNIEGPIKKSRKGTFSAFVKGTDFYLKNLDVGYKKTRATGRLSIMFENKWSSDIAFGTGSVKGGIKSLEFENIEAGIFTFSKILFPSVTFDIGFDKGKINIIELATDGGDFDLNGTGTIMVKKPLPQSRLNISGRFTVKEGSEFEEAAKLFSGGKLELSFTLTGTASRPRLKINNIPVG